MGIKQFVDPSIGPRRVARIITVHPETRKIEAQLKDGGNIQISLFDVPTMFVWPQVDEYWIVRQDGGYWKLNNKFDTNDDQKVIAMNPGEAKIAAEIIRTPSGKTVITAGAEDYQWHPLALINGWKDVSTFDEDQITTVSNLININSKYLTDLQKFAYRYNKFTESFDFRGIIYNNSFNSEIAIIESPKSIRLVFSYLGDFAIDKNGKLISTASSTGESAIVMSGISIQREKAN